MKTLLTGLVVIVMAGAVNAQATPGYINKLDKKIVGHWVCESTQDSMLLLTELMNRKDPLVFKRVPYKSEMYYWGGGAYIGLEFLTNGTFNEYTNMGCSEESSNVANSNEKWKAIGQGRVEVKGSERHFCLEVLELNGKELRTRLLPARQ